MTDLITISLPSITTIFSSTTTLISTNISADEILAITNGNTTTVGAPVPIWAGFIGCLVASLFFGSNLVPIKHFSAGDGFFFQLIFCVTVYIVGLIVDLIMNNQRFYPLVVVGGIRKKFFLNSFLYLNIYVYS